MAQFEKKNDGSSTTTTKTLAILSNYCWNRDNKDRIEQPKCTVRDCDVTLKLSSTAFQSPSTKDNDYIFDKQGVRFTYAQLYKLFRDETFVCDYLEQVKKYYYRDVSPPPPPPPQSSSGERRDNDPDDDDNNKGSKRSKSFTVNNAVVKKLKSL